MNKQKQLERQQELVLAFQEDFNREIEDCNFKSASVTLDLIEREKFIYCRMKDEF